MISHTAISEINLDPDFTQVVPGLEDGTVATVTVEVRSTTATTSQKETLSSTNPLWCIVFRNNNPSSIVFKCGGTEGKNTIYIPVEKTPLYVTHWEQIGDTMKQLTINPK